jgi:hypothetical protein
MYTTIVHIRHPMCNTRLVMQLRENPWLAKFVATVERKDGLRNHIYDAINQHEDNCRWEIEEAHLQAYNNVPSLVPSPSFVHWSVRYCLRFGKLASKPKLMWFAKGASKL